MKMRLDNTTRTEVGGEWSGEEQTTSASSSESCCRVHFSKLPDVETTRSKLVVTIATRYTCSTYLIYSHCTTSFFLVVLDQ